MASTEPRAGESDQTALPAAPGRTAVKVCGWERAGRTEMTGAIRTSAGLTTTAAYACSLSLPSVVAVTTTTLDPVTAVGGV
ncbi:hypothetical protein ACIBO2_32390 [Nonomuraea sp. NPDC050022]|uniref:hypothetical protein n=1 Tax=unclassified Nonomuraea TaxID=2593643 RepID=UPI0033C49B03